MIGIRWFFTEEKSSSHITPLDHQKIPQASRVVSVIRDDQRSQ